MILTLLCLSTVRALDTDYDFMQPSIGLTETGIPCRESTCFKCKVILNRRKDIKSKHPKLGF